MAYKPKNLASFRDDSSSYPKGSSTGKGGAVVPGTTGSQDRESQPAGAEFNETAPYGTKVNGHDFAFADGGINDRLSPRENPNFGKRSYAAGTPTLGDY